MEINEVKKMSIKRLFKTQKTFYLLQIVTMFIAMQTFAAEPQTSQTYYQGKEFPPEEIVRKGLQSTYPSNAKVLDIIGKHKISEDCYVVYYDWKQFDAGLKSGQICKLDTNWWIVTTMGGTSRM